jgi:hypothetical protein
MRTGSLRALEFGVDYFKLGASGLPVRLSGTSLCLSCERNKGVSKKKSTDEEGFLQTMGRHNTKRQRTEPEDDVASNGQVTQAGTKSTDFDKKYETDVNSNEQVLGMWFWPLSFPVFDRFQALQKKGCTSSYYAHFQDPVIIVEDGTVKYKFICQK